MAPLTLWHIYLLLWKLVPQQSKWDLEKKNFLFETAQNVLAICDREFTHLKWEDFQTKWVFTHTCYKEIFQIAF